MMELLCGNSKIRLSMDNSEKNAMLITGGSRMGKTYFASNLAAMLIRQGNQVHFIDLGSKWSIYDKERLQAAGASIREVESQGIRLVFCSVKELLGSAKVIVDAIGLQSAYAYKTLKNVMQKLCAEKNNLFLMNDILDILQSDIEEENPMKEWVFKLYEGLEIYGEAPRIQFCVAEHKFADASVIWDLSGLDNDYVRIISGLITYALFCRQKKSFLNPDAGSVYVLIDEFQNLDCSRRSIVGICLTEGQKYHLNLMLITQFLRGNFPDAVISQLKQCGFRFHFRLTEEEASIISRQIAHDYSRRNELYKKLINLPVGTCLMLGPHSIGGRKEVTEAFRFVEIKGTVAESSCNRGKVCIRK